MMVYYQLAGERMANADLAHRADYPDPHGSGFGACSGFHIAATLSA
jgi:hypothetical protein